MGMLDRFKNSRTKNILDESGGAFSVGGVQPVMEATRRNLINKYSELTFACISTIASDTAKYEPHILLPKNGEMIEDTEHRFLDVLHHPNPLQTPYEFWELAETYINIYGETFLLWSLGETSGEPLRVDILSAEKITIAVQEKPDPEGIYKVGDVIGYVAQSSSGNPVPLSLNEITHIKTTNPFNPYRGYSKIQAGLTSIGIDVAVSDFQLNFMHNNATPASIITVEGTISSELFRKIKKVFQANHRGPKNAGSSLFLRNNKVTINKVGLALGELDLKDLKELSGQRVRNMFKVPKPLLGDTDSAGLSRANIEAQEYIFQKYVIDGEKNRIDDALSQAASRFYPREQIYVTHNSDIPVDKEFELQKLAVELDKTISRNEYRETQGQNRIEGGDNLYIPMNMIPIQDYAQIAPTEPTTKTVRITKKTTTKAPKRYLSDLDRIKDHYTAGFQKAFVKGVTEQEKALFEWLDLHSGQKSIVAPVPTDAELAGILRSNNILNLVEQWFVGAYTEGGELAVSLSGKVNQEFVVEVAKRNAIRANQEAIVDRFGQQTGLKIQSQIAQAINENLSQAELKSRLQVIMGDAKGYRAERVARTEISRVTSEGNLDGWAQSGFDAVKYVVSDPCPECQQYENQIYAIDDSDRPDIPIHPNCRCDWEPTELKKRYAKITDEELADALQKQLMTEQELDELKEYTTKLEAIAGIDGLTEEA